MLSSVLHCPQCNLPFANQGLLDNHRQRFCYSSRVDREAQLILRNAGESHVLYGPRSYPPPQGGVASGGGYPSPPPPPPAAYGHMQPQHGFSRSPSSNGAGALPNVDMELYELVKRQNAQLQMMQALVHSGGRAPAYGRGTNGPPPPLSYQNAWVPSAPLWHQGGAPHHQQGGGLRPQPPTLPSPRQMMNVAAQGESTLSEGRYGFRLFALESLSSFLTDGQDVRRVSICLRQYVGSVEPSGLLVLDGIGEPKWFEPGCLAAAKGGRGQNDAQGTIRLKEPVESQFHVVQHGQLHVFVVELYDASDRLVAWSEAPADMLGEKARPLRTGLVEPAMALRFPQLRTTSSAVAGVEFFRVAWRQPSDSAEKRDKRSKRKDRRRSPSSSSTDSGSSSSSNRSRSSSSSDDGGRHRKSKRSSKKKTKKSPKRRHRRRSSSDDDEDDIPKLRSDADLKQHHRSTARDDPATEIRRNLVSDFTPPPASPTPPSLRPLRTSADGPVIPAGPTPMPPTPADTPMIPCGHGPHHDLVTIAIESVSGIPLNAIATRIVLYFSRTVEAATGRELWALNDRSFYVREPDAVITQELDSSVMDPKFAAEFSLVISPHTLVVAIVESLVPGPNNTMLRAVVGHSKLPIDQTFPSGNYLSRVRVGDPRPSHLRHAKPKTAQEDAAHYEEVDKYTVTQLELSGFSRDLHQLMQAHDEKKTQRNVEPQPASMMVPAAFIKWRADSNDPRGPYRDVPGQTTRSPAEMEIQRLRSQVKSQTARQRGIVSQDKLMDLFDEVALVPAQDDTVLSNVMPYDPEKGVFILVENLRGMTEEPSLLKVVVEVPKQVKKEGSSGSNASQMNFTRLHDWDSDIGVPQFLDAPFVFPNVPMDLNACVLFRVFKMIDPCMSPAGPVQPFAWGISKLFLEGGVARFGHFAIPLFAGKPPAALLEELDNTKIDQVILKWTQNVSNDHKVQYLKPRGLLTFVQGDALRTDEAHFPERLFPITRVISDDHKETEHMFPRAPPRVILIPQRSRREFPCHIDEGYKDKALREILPMNAEGQLEVSEKTFEEEMNRQIKQAFRTIALT